MGFFFSGSLGVGIGYFGLHFRMKNSSSKSFRRVAKTKRNPRWNINDTRHCYVTEKVNSAPVQGTCRFPSERKLPYAYRRAGEQTVHSL